MIRIALVLLAFALGGVAQPSSSEHFTYAGYSLQTLWSEMVSKYPHSSHEFWKSPEGKIFEPRDGLEKFHHAIASGSGKYLIRLSEDESKDGIYFIEFQIENGTSRAVKLSFEKPTEFVKTKIRSNAQRYPACVPILGSFIAQYGKPQNTQSNTEEALTEVTRTWTRGTEQLGLMCGRYYDEKKVFAMEITIGAAGQ